MGPFKFLLEFVDLGLYLANVIRYDGQAIYIGCGVSYCGGFATLSFCDPS